MVIGSSTTDYKKYRSTSISQFRKDRYNGFGDITLSESLNMHKTGTTKGMQRNIEPDKPDLKKGKKTMAEAPKSTGLQGFRAKLQEIYWLIIWVFLIILGLAIPGLNLGPAWAGWILFILGVTGAISRCVTFFAKSPLFILIEALDNFCVAILCGILFVLSLVNGGALTWEFGVFVVITVYLGINELKKYQESKAIRT